LAEWMGLGEFGARVAEVIGGLGGGIAGGYGGARLGGAVGSRFSPTPPSPAPVRAINPETLQRVGEPSEVFTNRTSEHPYRNPENMQKVTPDNPLDVNQLDPNEKYLWAVDKDGNFLVAPENQPDYGRPLKHGDLV